MSRSLDLKFVFGIDETATKILYFTADLQTGLKDFEITDPKFDKHKIDNIKGLFGIRAKLVELLKKYINYDEYKKLDNQTHDKIRLEIAKKLRDYADQGAYIAISSDGKELSFDPRFYDGGPSYIILGGMEDSLRESLENMYNVYPSLKIKKPTVPTTTVESLRNGTKGKSAFYTEADHSPRDRWPNVVVKAPDGFRGVNSWPISENEVPVVTTNDNESLNAKGKVIMRPFDTEISDVYIALGDVQRMAEKDNTTGVEDKRRILQSKLEVFNKAVDKFLEGSPLNSARELESGTQSGEDTNNEKTSRAMQFDGYYESLIYDAKTSSPG